MAAKGIHHTSITVTDFDRAKVFYDKLFNLLGAAQVMDVTGAPHKDADGRLALYAGNGFFVGVWSASKENQQNTFDRYNIGLHHLAFAASTRQDVDDLHRELVAMGATILDPPAEYPYVPGYYAVFFTDPDGIKLEYVYTP